MSNQKLKYIPDEGLKAAVEMAIKMELPLFLTGEPGTGKTELAYWVAEQYQGKEGISGEVLRFNVKTTSTAKDLLYRYDAIRHFRDSHRLAEKGAVGEKEELNVLDYIHFEALGQAIIAASNQKEEEAEEKEHNPKRRVVLVDEIDKAPRDFPNDLLFEFEKLGFRIEEATKKELNGYTGWKDMPSLSGLGVKDKPDMDAQDFIFYADKAERDKPRAERSVKKPVLILTSNSEKNLPDAFLRRCAFFHIPFPADKDKLLKILEAKGLYSKDKNRDIVDGAVDFFLGIRSSGLRRNPATAELIGWVEFLRELGINPKEELSKADFERLEPSLSLLGKNKEDLVRIKERVKVKG